MHNLFWFGSYEIAWYGWWWLLFVPIAYSAARYLGWLGFFGGVVLIAILVMVIDVNWIFNDMREHPENGRDADFIFLFGVFCRVVIFNAVLLPATISGLIIQRRRRRILPESKGIEDTISV